MTYLRCLALLGVLSIVASASAVLPSDVIDEESQLQNHDAEQQQRIRRRDTTPEADLTNIRDLATTVTHCGCAECTDTVWNKAAPADAPPGFTCGSRILYVQSTGKSNADACRAIAGGSGITGEFPAVCGACNPDKCTKVERPSTGPNPTELYCFKPSSSRKRWTNVWSKYTVEVKSASNRCGPGGNQFSDSTVAVSSNKKELTLQFKNVNGVWSAGEVRVMLPAAQQPYSYGTFSMRIKSVGVIDTTTGRTLRKSLDPALAIGMFTWDPTPAAADAYHNEVDIEISKWGKPNATTDAQFLVQPPKSPQFFRFSTGPKKGTMDPGSGNWYNVTWRPTSLLWRTSAGGGIKHSYTTAQALRLKKEDYIQCLPATVEIRMNLWHSKGAVRPPTMADTHVAQVVIDQFVYTPNYILGVANGETCSKTCQCLPTSRCVNNKCRAKS
jgi:hypothetical protein